ncbi:hypothetical protein AB0K15_06730 [Amycolatopsis sp. NPDC049253]|uniref:hypothetical protein n=1 Tax=Amycolatopsis sp. NPDC049253 TaxID=3155274 RepID=UPI0034323CFA
MERLIRHDLSETDVRPGSTLRPIVRFELQRDGDTMAGVTLGRAEVLERQPLAYTLARWSFPAGDLAAGAVVLTAGANPALRGAPLYLDINDSAHEDADDRCTIAREARLRAGHGKASAGVDRQRAAVDRVRRPQVSDSGRSRP